MKRAVFLWTLIFLVGAYNSASAGYFGTEFFKGKYNYGYINQGSYLGTVYGEHGSNANGDVETLRKSFDWYSEKYEGMTESGSSLYGKSDEKTLFVPAVADGSRANRYKSGKWQTFPLGKPGGVTDLVDFITAKGGNRSSVRRYRTAAYSGESGERNVDYLPDAGQSQNPLEASRLSTYVSSSDSVSEPATMLLLGTGLICLAGLGRKKILKK